MIVYCVETKDYGAEMARTEKRVRGPDPDPDPIWTWGYNCNECKNKLVCLLDPYCNRIFESK